MMPQSWLPNISLSQSPGPTLIVQQPEEWDPLDPSNLARIADPNQAATFETQKSTTLAGQTPQRLDILHISQAELAEHVSRHFRP